jgi:tRNA dimethylallyltransferase
MLALVGPTATGKSAIAMMVAQTRGDVEIVVVDAMQVYRRMDIGTAKPTTLEQQLVRHHMIDVAEPSVDYSLSLYQRDALAAIADIEARGRVALLVGGTGLYLRAVSINSTSRRSTNRFAARSRPTPTRGPSPSLVELDPVAASRMEPSNRRRIVRALEVTLGSGRPFSSFGPGLAAYASTTTRFSPSAGSRTLDTRIEARYAQQMEMGLLDEVRALLDEPAGLSRTAAQALGYKELIEHLRGDVIARRCAGHGHRSHQAVRPPPGALVSSRSAHTVARRIKSAGGPRAVLEECNPCD